MFQIIPRETTEKAKLEKIDQDTNDDVLMNH